MLHELIAEDKRFYHNLILFPVEKTCNIEKFLEEFVLSHLHGWDKVQSVAFEPALKTSCTLISFVK